MKKEPPLIEDLSVLPARAYTALVHVIKMSHESDYKQPHSFAGPINTKDDLKREIIRGTVAKQRYVGHQVFNELCRLVGLDPSDIKGKRLCPTCGTLV